MNSKKLLILSIVLGVVAVLGGLYAAEGYTSYQTNKDVWDYNMQSYEEYSAAGDTENAELQLSYATEAYGRVSDRKTQMGVGGIVFLLSGGAAVFAYRKRKNA